MIFELTGKLFEKYDTQQMNDNFKKRDFVIEVVKKLNGNKFTDYIKLQLTQDRCNLIDMININDYIKVNFNIKGRKWEKEGNVNYFNTLDAWRVEKVDDYNLKPFDDNLVIPDESIPPF
ncbi:hypothetical protein MASR1M45_20280 [Candidatus Kapaibacterium sp.]